jgi:RHS repeat-associated protein
MSFFAPKTIVGFMVGAALVAASLVGVAGTAQAASPGIVTPHLDDPGTASISGAVTWQAITGGGSETPNPQVELDYAGQTTDGGRDSEVATQMSTDGTYSFSGLSAGTYVVKVTDYIPNQAPVSYYPTTYYGGEFSYEAATPISLAAGQSLRGKNVRMLVGATVVGTITGVGGAALPYVEDLMLSATAEGEDTNESRNDEADGGTTKLDEAKGAGSDASGNVLIRGIAPDTYFFRYAGDDTFSLGNEYAPGFYKNATFRRDATLLTTQLGHTYTVNERLSPTASIGGTLTDKAGTTIHGGYAVLYNAEEPTDDSDGVVNTTTVFGAGYWRFDLLGPGTYKVGFTQAANAITPTGALGASYPFVSSWYGGTSYATAQTITVTSGHSVTGIAGVMPYDESFLDNWVAEQSGGNNASEPYCQCFSGDPINDATGEFYLNGPTDLSLPGAGPAVSLARSYSSTNAATDGPFGFGWSTGLASRLDVITPSTTGGEPAVVQVTQENGATVRFTLDVNGVYEAPPRVLASLTLNPDGSWAFTRRATTILNFTSAGVLTSIADLHGNAVTYGYNAAGQVSTISGSGGRQISLNWDGSHITSATDSAGRSVGYGYDSAGELTATTDVDGNTGSYSYDPSHQLVTVVKPGGGATTNTYDSSGRVTQQVDPVGRATTWAYSGDASDETTTITEPDGAIHSEHYLNLILASTTDAVGTSVAATTSYQYNEALEVLTKTDALKKSTTYTWDTNGNELSETTPLHDTTTKYYDALNDLEGSTDPLGNNISNSYDSTGNLLSASTGVYNPATFGYNTTRFTYNANGTVATRRTPNGYYYVYGYNAAGQLTSITDPNGATSTTAYNAAGFVTSATDALGNTTSYTVDAAGHILSSIDALGNVATSTYDADGNRLTVTDPEAHATSTTYDADDEKTSSTDGNGHTTTYVTGSNGLLASVTDPDGGSTRYIYNAAEEKTETINPVGDKTIYRYDLDRRPTSTTAPGGGLTTSSHNADGDVVTVKDPRGNSTTYTYNADDRKVTGTDALARVTTTTYTADGKVASVTQPDGSVKTYTYDADDNTISQVNADGLATTYTYDGDDRQTSQTAAGGITTAYAYDAAGRQTKTTKADGSYITMAYDADSRLTSSKPSAAHSVTTTYLYGANGERKSVHDASGATSYSYDAVGQVRAVKNGDAQLVKYSYDKAGHILTITYPTGGIVTYAYDRAGEMTSVKDWNSNTTTFTWTPDGKLSTQVGADGVTETRAYDAADNVTQIADATSTTTLATYGYGYDAATQLTSDSTTDPDVSALAHTYTYDADGQLASANDGTTATPYAATSGGELIASGSAPSETYNASSQLTAATTSGGASVTYGYDANGERTGASSTSGSVTSLTNYTYDAYGNLASASLATGTATYKSNADGLRQSETVGGTTSHFAWDTQSSVALLLDDGTHSYIYGSSTTPLSQVADEGNTTQYLHGDALGSVRLITDASGNATGTTEYDPYGNVSSQTGSAKSAIGFTGALTDAITALVYLRARDYDPLVGQFLSIDPVLRLSNQAYAYVGNDPLQFIDALGLINGWAIVGAIGLGLAIAGLAVTGIGLVADAPLVAVEASVVTEITVEGVAGATEATVATTTTLSATITAGGETSAFTTAATALNGASTVLDAADCLGTRDVNACTSAALGTLGVGFGFLGSAGSLLRYGGQLIGGVFGLGAGGTDIGSGAYDLSEIGGELIPIARC